MKLSRAQKKAVDILKHQATWVKIKGNIHRKHCYSIQVHSDYKTEDIYVPYARTIESLIDKGVLVWSKPYLAYIYSGERIPLNYSMVMAERDLYAYVTIQNRIF